MLNRPQLTRDSDFWAPSPLVFLFFPAWKQNKAKAGGTQNDIETLRIVPSASSSTFLGWLGSGPPVLGYCSSSTEPQTWPQLTAAASTDHCGVQAGWWLSLPHQSSLSVTLSDSYQDLLPQLLCILSGPQHLSPAWQYCYLQVSKFLNFSLSLVSASVHFVMSALATWNNRKAYCRSKPGSTCHFPFLSPWLVRSSSIGWFWF